MYLEQLYTNCLAQAAYFIESDGEAVVIDPIREIDSYLEKAAERNCKLKYIFETHFHADFVSGHLELAHRTGAEIVFGDRANPNFKAVAAVDGQIFTVGKLKIKVIHTPGHTPESVCYLLHDENDRPYALFSGDTLFVGDVGRPDLAVAGPELTQQDLAGMLFDSLNSKIKLLPDDVLLYPAHGPGSQCGKNLGKETFSTLGTQKKQNYALLINDKEEFIRQLTDGLAPPPKYFFDDARINREGYIFLPEILKKNLVPLDIWETLDSMNQGATVLDTRDPDTFAEGFIPGAINVGLNGSFAVWVGSIIDIDTPLVIVAESGKETEVITRLARVGYENVKGYLEGGFENWKNEGLSIDFIPNLTPAEIKDYVEICEILDVRKPGERETVSIPGSVHLPLDAFPTDAEELKNKKDTGWVIHCAGGYRSMIAASYLKRYDIEPVFNVKGGMGRIRSEAPELVSGVA